jgi:hypothetical protein
MNQVTTTSNNTVLAAYGGANPFAAAAAAMGAQEGNFLKFNGNSGDFTYGQKDDELPHGTQLAADMIGFSRGWICWKDGEVEDEINVPILQGEPPLEHTLPDHGPYTKHDDGSEDGWVEQAKINFRDVETGEAYIYKATSKSGRRALGSLLKDFSKQFHLHDGETPVVEISGLSYTPKDKKLGKKYAPVFKIVGWLNAVEMGELEDSAPAKDAPATATTNSAEDDPANYVAKDDHQQRSETPSSPTSRTRDAAPAATPQTDAPATGRRAKRF